MYHIAFSHGADTCRRLAIAVMMFTPSPPQSHCAPVLATTFS